MSESARRSRGGGRLGEQAVYAGTGISAAIGAGLAALEGGSPLEIAIRTAYGATPIPPGIGQLTTRSPGSHRRIAVDDRLRHATLRSPTTASPASSISSGATAALRSIRTFRSSRGFAFPLPRACSRSRAASPGRTGMLRSRARAHQIGRRASTASARRSRTLPARSPRRLGFARPIRNVRPLTIRAAATARGKLGRFSCVNGRWCASRPTRSAAAEARERWAPDRSDRASRRSWEARSCLLWAARSVMARRRA